MATHQAVEEESRVVDHTPALVTALEQFAKTFDEINRFVVYFESRNNDIRKEVFIGEDLLRQHLESWRIVFSSVWIVDLLNTAGDPASKPLQSVRDVVIKNEKQLVKDVLATLLSLKARFIGNALEEISEHLRKSIPAFEYDQKEFNRFIDAQDFQIVYAEDEIRNIIDCRMEVIPDLTLGRDAEIMPECDMFSYLVDRKIQLHSEIAKRKVIKEIISDLSHKLAILIRSMEALVETSDEITRICGTSECSNESSTNSN